MTESRERNRPKKKPAVPPIQSYFFRCSDQSCPDQHTATLTVVDVLDIGEPICQGCDELLEFMGVAHSWSKKWRVVPKGPNQRGRDRG